MKRKSLLFLLLMALFAPLAMNGQQTATFNEGTTTNSYLPFYGSYADYGTKGQFIIPATDLASNGITSGSEISKLVFYSNASSGETYFGTSCIVEVGEVSYSTFSTNANTFVTSGLTTVLSGAPNTLTRNSDGTMEVSFNSNYTYNGGNLLISIGGYGSNYASTNWLGVNTNNAGVYGNQSYSTQGSIPTTATMVSFAPKTTITYIPGTTPYIILSPTSATVYTGFSETLTVTYGNVTNPTITYSSSNTSVATVSGSGTTATVTAVAEGTATITATMNGSYTATCAITVMDACQPTWTSSSYYISNFTVSKSETTLLNNSSTGTGGSTTNYYATQSIMAEPGDELSCVITMNSSSTYGFAMWVDFDQDGLDSGDLIFSTSSYNSSPYTITLNIPANASAGEYRMRIWGDWSKNSASDPCGAYANGEAEDYKLIVNAGAYHITCNATTNGSISVDHGSADAGETITVTAVPETNYELTALSYNDGSDHNISFSNNQGTFTMPAADVTVSATFSIMRNLPPYDLTVGTPGGHSVELGWTGVSTNTNHQSFDLYYSTDPVMPQTPVQSSFIGGITASSYELNGLAPTTTYYAWVRDNCGTDGYSDWVAFTSFTTDVTCPAPTNVAANQVTNNSAVINWEGNAESYNLRYGTCAVDPNQPATIILTVGDVWQDGSGYQMLLDADATAYGTVIPETGALSTSCSDNDAIYAEFEYKIPTNADGNCSTSNIVINNSVSIEIPAGTYDWCITNPTPGDRIWIASSNGNIGGRADDYVFEGGKTYTFNLYLSGENDATDVTITCNNLEWTYVNNVTSPYTLEGLSPETDYVLDVQANCGSEDGTSEWVSTTFTTLDACATPYELNATNLTAASATLNWTGAQEAYNVQYREVITEPVNLTYDFEDGTQGWTTIDADGHGNAWSRYNGEAHNGSYSMRAKYNSSYAHQDYLVSPQITLGGSLSFYAKKGGSYTDTFRVYLSTSGNTSASDFTIELTNGNVEPTTTYTQYTYDLSDYTGMGYVAIVYTAPKDQYYLYVDDITIVRQGEYGPWVTKTNITSPLNLDDLTPTIENGNHYLPINYEWQVQGINCDGNGTATDWSAPVTFTTPEGYVKHITGYGTGTGNWYLIASPIGNVAPTEVTNMLSNNYDLFYFDDAKENEWVNYKPNTSGQGNASTNPGFGLEKGKGYLYANSQTVDLIFTGYALTTTVETVELDYTAGDGVDLPGWNLVGNPFAEIAYLAGNCAFYTMDSDGNFTPTTNASIEAMEGIFVEVSATGQTLTFTTEQQAKSPVLNLNLSNGRKVIDRAIVRFDGGKQLSKLQFRQGSTKVYIPVEGHDYAVVNSEEMGEMPVSFKAEENGTYTFSFNAEEVSFAYLHLIDNMTGADVDLLETPSYSFEAKTTDYASRFKLVFATGNASDDNFAFFSNGSFVINNEGNAELQVVDVMGRIVKSESINGCANVSVNGAAGVYMLRLVNGDNVKVQKVVVK